MPVDQDPLNGYENPLISETLRDLLRAGREQRVREYSEGGTGHLEIAQSKLHERRRLTEWETLHERTPGLSAPACYNKGGE